MKLALNAFCRTCSRLARKNGNSISHGMAADWQAICMASNSKPEPTAFFEDYFQPYRLTLDGSTNAHLTGYYEPLLKGNRTCQGVYQTPLHTKSGDLVEVRPGDFIDSLSGKVVRGWVEDGRLKPYPDRVAIVAGALLAATELLYVDDPVAAFFLQIQGSGRIELENGSIVRQHSPGRDIAAINPRLAAGQSGPGNGDDEQQSVLCIFSRTAG